MGFLSVPNLFPCLIFNFNIIGACQSLSRLLASAFSLKIRSPLGAWVSRAVTLQRKISDCSQSRA